MYGTTKTRTGARLDKMAAAFNHLFLFSSFFLLFSLGVFYISYLSTVLISIHIYAIVKATLTILAQINCVPIPIYLYTLKNALSSIKVPNNSKLSKR